MQASHVISIKMQDGFKVLRETDCLIPENFVFLKNIYVHIGWYALLRRLHKGSSLETCEGLENVCQIRRYSLHLHILKKWDKLISTQDIAI